jgi:hypothetical protein
MSNPNSLANLVRPFTPESARIAAVKSSTARQARKQRERELVERAVDLLKRHPTPAEPDARRARTLKQVDRIDDEIDRCLDRRQFDRLPELTSAKDKLWKLVEPSAGTMKPSRPRREVMREL